MAILPKELYDSYIEKGFALKRLDKNTKKTAFKRKTDKGCDYKNNVYNKNWFYAVVPTPQSNILNIDVDVKNGGKGMESLDKLRKDTGLDLTPTVQTGSGGLHIYARIDEPIKKLQTDYPDIDFLSFRTDNMCAPYGVAGGQKLTWNGKAYNYEMLTDGIYINEDTQDGLALALTEMGIGDGEKNDTDYGDDMILLAKSGDMPDDEVDLLLKAIGNTGDGIHYDLWINVGFAMFDRYHGNDAGFEKWVAFSEKSDKYDEKATKQKWESGALSPDKITYKRLRLMATDTTYNTVLKSIMTADTKDVLEEVLPIVREVDNWNTPDLRGDDVINNLADKYREKLKSITGGRIERRSKIISLLTEEEVDQTEDMVALLGTYDIYSLPKGQYVAQNGENIETKVSDRVDSAPRYISIEGFSMKNVTEAMKRGIIGNVNVSGIEERIDYAAKQPLVVYLEDVEFRDPLLVFETNPVLKNKYKVDNMVADADIVEDFYEKIWNGKYEDLVRYTGFTCRWDTKKSIIGVIAASDAGKSKVIEEITEGATEIDKIISAISGKKGIGKKALDPLQKTKILLINEVETQLPTGMKQFADGGKVGLDLFGAHGGTTMFSIASTILTAVHPTMFKGANEEFHNRSLMIELTEDEMAYAVTDSPLYKKDPAKYLEHTVLKARQIFKDAILNTSYTLDDRNAIAKKYELGNEFSDKDMVNRALDIVMRDIAKHCTGKDKFTKEDVVAKRKDEYFVTNKQYMERIVLDSVNEVGFPNKYAAVHKIMSILIKGKGTDRAKVCGIHRFKIHAAPADVEEMFEDCPK